MIYANIKKSVIDAGGNPYIIDYKSDSAEDVIASVDGLILTGGGDLDPQLYGGKQHPMLEDVNSLRDEFELSLIKKIIRYSIAYSWDM